MAKILPLLHASADGHPSQTGQLVEERRAIAGNLGQPKKRFEVETDFEEHRRPTAGQALRQSDSTAWPIKDESDRPTIKSMTGNLSEPFALARGEIACLHMPIPAHAARLRQGGPGQ